MVKRPPRITKSAMRLALLKRNPEEGGVLTVSLIGDVRKSCESFRRPVWSQAGLADITWWFCDWEIGGGRACTV